MTGVSASKSAPQLCVASSPVNHQSPKQCELMLLGQISRAKCTEFLSIYPLPIPFLSLLLVGWDEGMAWVILLVNQLCSATLPFLMWPSLLLQVWMVCSSVFRVNCVCCGYFPGVYEGGGFEFTLPYSTIFFPLPLFLILFNDCIVF